MTCSCSQLPALLKVQDHSKFIYLMEQLDMANWMRLFRCKICDQLWAIDEWDKYQSQFAFKMTVLEGWQKVNLTPMRKQHLIESRGGLTEEKCVWSGCNGRRVQGVAYCVDHLYETGARE
jgi:hypothetical protein